MNKIPVLLAAMASLLSGQAQAQGFEFQDGLQYRPHLHTLAVLEHRPLAYEFGGIRPGVHLGDIYDLRFREELSHHACRYDHGTVLLSCSFYLLSGELPELGRSVALRAEIDRRTGTVLSTTFGPGPSGPTISLEAVRVMLTERFGNPTDETDNCARWSQGEIYDDAGHFTSHMALCRTDRQPWSLWVYDPELRQALDQFGDSPVTRGFGTRSWIWSPVWEPREILGVEAGMDARVAAMVLGRSLDRARCEEGARFSLNTTECNLGQTGLAIAGVPLQASIRFEDQAFLQSLTLMSPWTDDVAEVLRWHAAISEVLEGKWGPRDPGDDERFPNRSWVDAPFSTSVRVVFNDDSRFGSEPRPVYAIEFVTSVYQRREAPANW